MLSSSADFFLSQQSIEAPAHTKKGEKNSEKNNTLLNAVVCWRSLLCRGCKMWPRTAGSDLYLLKTGLQSLAHKGLVFLFFVSRPKVATKRRYMGLHSSGLSTPGICQWEQPAPLLVWTSAHVWETSESKHMSLSFTAPITKKAPLFLNILWGHNGLPMSPGNEIF